MQRSRDSKAIEAFKSSPQLFTCNDFVGLVCSHDAFGSEAVDSVGIEDGLRAEVLAIKQEDENVAAMQHAFTKGEDSIRFLENLFNEADEDGSKTLSTNELAALVKAYYKHSKIARSLKLVTAEVIPATRLSH